MALHCVCAVRHHNPGTPAPQPHRALAAQCGFARRLAAHAQGTLASTLPVARPPLLHTRPARRGMGRGGMGRERQRENARGWAAYVMHKYTHTHRGDVGGVCWVCCL